MNKANEDLLEIESDLIATQIKFNLWLQEYTTTTERNNKGEALLNEYIARISKARELIKTLYKNGSGKC